MNMGRGFTLPQENAVQNGGVWPPTTPEKPVLQRNRSMPSEIPQHEPGQQDWRVLLGMYSGLLQDEGLDGGPERVSLDIPTVSPVNHVNMLQQNPETTGVVELPNLGRDVDRVPCQHMLHQELWPRIQTEVASSFQHGVEDSRTLEMHRRWNQNDVRVRSSSYAENLGEAMRPYQKVQSLAELMGITGTKRDPYSNGAHDMSTSVVGEPAGICPYYNESHHGVYASDRTELNEDLGLHAHHNVGGYNLPEMTNSRRQIIYQHSFNLNLQPTLEEGKSSSAPRPLPLGLGTPDAQRRSINNHVIQVPHVLIDDIEERKKQKKVFSPETLEGEHNKFLVDAPCASIAASSTPRDVKNNSEVGDEVTGLNKTPQQKTPKRKKHRPKVVVEGKPKRTPKPATAKSNTPGGNSTMKRSYVRKNGIKKTKTSSADSENAEVSDVGPAKKSCRRALNFNSDDGAEKPIQDREFECQSEKNKWSKHPSSFSEVHKYMSDTHKQQPGTAFPFFMSTISTQDYVPTATMVPQTTPRDHSLNVIARSFNTRNARINQSSDRNACNRIHYDFSGSYLGSKRHSLLQKIPQNQEDLLDLAVKQGFQSAAYANNEMRQLQTTSFTGSKVFLHGLSEIGNSSRGNSGAWENGPEVGEKNKIVDTCDGTLSSSLSRTVGGYSAQTKSQMTKNFLVQSSLVDNNDGVNKAYNPDIRQRLQQQQAPMSEHLSLEGMTQMIFQHNATGKIMNSGTMVTRWDGERVFQRCSRPNTIDETISSPDCVAVKKRTAGQTSWKKVSQDSTNSRSYGKSYKKTTGSQEKRTLFSIDDLTSHFKDLQISHDSKEMIQKDQGALVPYRVDGAIVPYMEFDPVKKRRSRPKVDLDPETNRLWNLLMCKGQSESAETMDTEKQKWWEEERKVFQGRVKSFIARMHLVQGDRRFSKWKGSVVDSVVGVFLTQNVSDHLSSSAFMCLAAKFPPKSKNAKQTQPGNGESSSADHLEIHVTYPDGTHDDSEIVRESAYNESSTTCTGLSECREANAGIGKGTSSISNYTMRSEEDVISSQSSSESFIFQAPEDIRPSSRSNPETDGGCNFSKKTVALGISGQAEINVAYEQYKLPFTGSIFPNKKSLIGHQQLENIAQKQNAEQASSSNVYSYSSVSESSQNQSSILQSANTWAEMSIGLEKWEADFLASSGNETMSSLTAINFEGTKGTGIEASNDSAGLFREGCCTDAQYERLKFQQHQVSHAFSIVSSELRMDLQNGSLNKSGPRGPQYTPTESENWKRTCSTTVETAKMVHPTEERQYRSSSMHSTITTNAIKRRTQKEKTAPFNWDNLRKQAETKTGIKERSWEATDSLDYEALRNANVHEISETIKERGMNNMLAERIKDFLDRLVKDHERMDLEWLRDVPPDQAKDYLLSIRGLGLKSVECVRLLTLHHLAFPVDTNVGRIVVRLGWVPLQPLPESLQLHLLELYPVLETIQKYLWPRLCQLDQETLYELHYQMITFGKVFCTKRQPNCNACPLRGECRHFASAFASARLALPGPEERRIVSLGDPINVNKSTDNTINRMALPPPMDYIGREVGLPRDCEPVIEEPTTPESPITISVRDIEDAFWEDPDEIPVIQLSVEEFTSNLESFMRKNMEIGEADMSKALVALSPNVASLPIPKLKNVSRLRTEHHVYELPDWHPLLEGMDRREADDPSPYLLAIWTPGETADSVQPPESKCISQGQGGLCNNEACFSCNNAREARAQTVRGTILIPCRTAMRGSFPLNGTYFQVNEVFADHASSLTPIDVPRSMIWNLPRRTVFFGTSVSTIFRGLSTEDIQYCFWKGFVCVRGFEQKSRAPRPLMARLHFPASKMAKKNE